MIQPTIISSQSDIPIDVKSTLLNLLNDYNLQRYISYSVSSETTATATITAGSISSLTSTISWVSPSTNLIFSIPFYRIYVDVDNDDDYLWNSGGSLSYGQANLQMSSLFLDYPTDKTLVKHRIILKNEDTSSHTYYIHMTWRSYDPQNSKL
jgi:hypothetical protein